MLLLLYDSGCRLCRWSVGWLLRRDPDRSVMPVPIQSARGAELLAELEPAARLRSVHVIDRDGVRHSAGAAVRVLLDQPAGTRRLARLAGLSPAATEFGYRLVSRHRGRIGRLIGQPATRRADELIVARAGAGTD